MFTWKFMLGLVMPTLEAIGEAKVNEDDNDTGKDDIIGQSILFSIKLLKFALDGKAKPTVPDILK